jgi:hypothetical protein
MYCATHIGMCMKPSKMQQACNCVGLTWCYLLQDTFFFMPHVKQLLAHYDHNKPLIIADK